MVYKCQVLIRDVNWHLSFNTINDKSKPKGGADDATPTLCSVIGIPKLGYLDKARNASSVTMYALNPSTA